MLKGMNTSEKFGSFLKGKHTTTLGPSPSTLKNLLKRNEGMCPHKDLYINIFAAELFVIGK